MIWFSLLGAAVALKENRHIRIQFWEAFLSPKVMVIGDFVALDILDTWLVEEYEGGRHDISLGLIEESEKSLCCEKLPAYENIFHGEKK